MPQVVSKDLDALNTQVTVTIPVSDYEPKFKAELKKHQQKSALKGFRKGKTPINVIIKMFGDQVLGGLINQLLEEEINNFLKEAGPIYLGQPVPSKETPTMTFDPKNLQDFEFRFDLGKIPEFEIKGIDEKASFSKYDTKVEKKVIDKELESFTKRFGEEVEIEDDIQEGDRIKATVKELDGKKVKADGLTASVTVLVNDMEDDIKKKVLKKKKGDTIKNINIYKLDKQLSDKAAVDKHLLGLEEGETVGENFDFTIDEVIRITPAKLNQELYNKSFGEGVVKTKKEALEKLKAPILNHFNAQAEAILNRDIQIKLLEENLFDLPEEFLQRWLLLSNEGLDEKQLKVEFPAFVKSLRWDLITSKLAKENDLQVTVEEIKANLAEKIKDYYGGVDLPEETMNSIVDGVLKNQDEYYRISDEIYNGKIFKFIEGKVTITKKSITTEKFEALIKELVEKDQQSQADKK